MLRRSRRNACHLALLAVKWCPDGGGRQRAPKAGVELDQDTLVLWPLRHLTQAQITRNIGLYADHHSSPRPRAARRGLPLR